ncbi:transporter [Campylobacter concisus]|uniref:Membrane protein, exporter n=1 Tax=Campylobacter concisus ATCC 51562 TaxID=1242969 RepID=U2F891_9BACT|nr:transporter [Campylobacter concisus]ERJ26160.1 membrane protein, exporter [Campylobacter concisus ATCC 51562]
MKKLATILAFIFIFLASLGYSLASLKNVQTDIFSLINFKDAKEAKVLKEVQDEMASNFLVLVNSKELAKNVQNLALKSSLFKSFEANIEINLNDIKSDINRSKIALLSRADLELLKNDKNAFFKKRAEEIFSSFSFRLLNVKDDFFSLSSGFSVKNGNVSLNLADLMLEVKDGEKSFFLLKGELKKGASSEGLINFYNELNALKVGQNELFVHSSAIYQAFSKQKNESESLYMSVVSLSLTAIFLMLAFRNLRIFYVIFIAVFGFIVAFAGTLLCLGELNILTILISTSLIGLMFDYVLHWLSKNEGEVIRASSIKNMLKIFLLGLFITLSGYLAFTFSDLRLLKEVALFSAFALVAAFLASYFFMPLVFEGVKFYRSKLFDRFLTKFCKLSALVARHLGVKFLAFSLILLAIFLGFDLKNLSKSENVKDYSNMPKSLLADSSYILSLTGNNQNTMIVTRSRGDILGDEKSLLTELKKRNLIKDESSLSDMFLSKSEQGELKEAFKKVLDDEQIYVIYEKFGFSKDEVRSEILKVLDQKELSANEILALKSMRDFKKFMLDENASVAYASGFVKVAQSYEVLERHNAFSLNFADSLNESLTQAKELALKLKIAALVVAFLLLWFYFSALISALVMGVIIFGVLLTLFIFAIFGINLSIFGVFGLILASAVGIDYMIFALNDSLSEKERIYGIFCAFITSFISFFTLSFSQTAALSVFGLSVSLCVLIYGLCASVLSCKNIKI